GIAIGRARTAAAIVPRCLWTFTRKRMPPARSEKSAEPSLSIRSRKRPLVYGASSIRTSSADSASASLGTRRPPRRRTGHAGNEQEIARRALSHLKENAFERAARRCSGGWGSFVLDRTQRRTLVAVELFHQLIELGITQQLRHGLMITNEACQGFGIQRISATIVW